MHNDLDLDDDIDDDDDTDNVDDILWVVDDCGLSDVADCAIDLLGRGNIEELSFFESL